MNWGRELALVMALVVTLSGLVRADTKFDEPRYWVTRKADDPRFIVAMARMSKCHLPGKAKKGTVMRIPAELYPEESVRLHEEGTVAMELLFDDDWCVRKATILESSGFFRLDAVSLQYAMHLKFMFEVKERIDGQPVLRVPIAWGASQAGKAMDLNEKYGAASKLRTH
jgi:hypothetical protein